MRVFYILATILIATGVSSHMVPEKHLSSPHDIRGGDFSSEIETPVNLLKQKCDKNGGPEAYDTLRERMRLVASFLMPLMNTRHLVAEVNDARSNGKLNNVIKKYCGIVPIVHAFGDYAADSIKPCLETEERKSVDLLREVNKSTLDFICYKEGERISTFVAAGGSECADSQQEALRNCTLQSFSSYIPDDSTAAADSLGPLEVLRTIQRAKLCTDLGEFRDCSVRALANCENRTPSELLNSLIDSVRHGMTCENLVL